MVVYVVRGIVEYEGSDILGIFAKPEDADARAEVGKKEYLIDPDYPTYDRVLIDTWEVK